MPKLVKQSVTLPAPAGDLYAMYLGAQGAVIEIGRKAKGER